MEGIQTIQALKAVQSSLPAQTTIPSDELVMLYAADGTPIAKIARDDLVKAVASVMASNSQTTFSKLLGVQANGTPMGIGASDLASVLGVSLYLITSPGTEVFRKICHIPSGNTKRNACFIFGAAKAQYKTKNNNYSQLVTVISYPGTQDTDLPLVVEGVNIGETRFYYKVDSNGTDVFVNIDIYSDAAWLRILCNNGIDFSHCLESSTETTSSTTRC